MAPRTLYATTPVTVTATAPAAIMVLQRMVENGNKRDSEESVRARLTLK